MQRITGLDETVQNRPINRILMGQPKKVDGVKTQEVRMEYLARCEELCYDNGKVELMI